MPERILTSFELIELARTARTMAIKALQDIPGVTPASIDTLTNQILAELATDRRRQR